MNLLLKTDIFCTKRCLATVSNNSATAPLSLLVIRNGHLEVHARTLTSVCKSGIVIVAPTLRLEKSTTRGAGLVGVSSPEPLSVARLLVLP